MTNLSHASVAQVCQKFTDQGYKIEPAYKIEKSRPVPNWLDDKGEIKTGMYLNMPNEIYHNLEGISSTMLKTLILDTPAHYNEAYNHGEEHQEDTEQEKARPKHFTAGELLHALILEPNKVADRYYREPALSEHAGALTTDAQIKAALKAKDQPMSKTGEKKADRIARLSDIDPDVQIYDLILEKAAEANKGKESIPASIWDKAKKAHAAFKERAEAQLWIDRDFGLPELSIIARCPVTGMIVRCRPDFTRLMPVIDGCITPPLMTDVKSSASARPEKFARSVGDFGYHIQQAFYEYVFACLFNHTPSAFGFLVVEFEKAAIAETMAIDDETMSATRAILKPALRKLKKCIEEDTWHGYTESGVTTISLAPWALKQMAAITGASNHEEEFGEEEYSEEEVAA